MIDIHIQCNLRNPDPGREEPPRTDPGTDPGRETPAPPRRLEGAPAIAEDSPRLPSSQCFQACCTCPCVHQIDLLCNYGQW